MSDTDELRRMLNECGVEHGDLESAPYPPYNSTKRMTTFWVNKCVWQYIEDERKGGDIELVGRYMSMSVTPEQAIAATLGNVDLLAENAKLRELVHILAHCAAGHGCDICQINGGEGLINTLDMCESVHDRMRELGIEVAE